MPPLSEPTQYLGADSLHSTTSIDSMNSMNSTISFTRNKSSSYNCKQQEKQNKKQQRRVTFSKVGTAMRVRHINDYRPSEKQNCWYTKQETRQMRDDVMNSIAALREVYSNGNKTREPQDGIVRRGIECRMRESAEVRQAHKNQVTKAVLTEQQMQWDEGSNDPDYIALIYGRKCATSLREAQRRASRDAKEAAVSWRRRR